MESMQRSKCCKSNNNCRLNGDITWNFYSECLGDGCGYVKCIAAYARIIKNSNDFVNWEKLSFQNWLHRNYNCVNNALCTSVELPGVDSYNFYFSANKNFPLLSIFFFFRLLFLVFICCLAELRNKQQRGHNE